VADEDHRTEAAILGITRRVQGFEPHAAVTARLRHAVKRFEAAAGAGTAGNGAEPQQRRRVK
jgi:hypothetical protein